MLSIIKRHICNYYRRINLECDLLIETVGSEYVWNQHCINAVFITYVLILEAILGFCVIQLPTPAYFHVLNNVAVIRCPIANMYCNGKDNAFQFYCWLVNVIIYKVDFLMFSGNIHTEMNHYKNLYVIVCLSVFA